MHLSLGGGGGGGGKTPILLVGRRKVVCNIWSNALEFRRVYFPPYLWAGEKSSAISGVMHLSLMV